MGEVAGGGAPFDAACFDERARSGESLWQVAMASQTIRNFMKQQGFAEETGSACDMHFAGLSFQPRIIAPLVLMGIVLHSTTLFLFLSAVLWWSALVPALNPFEIAYNRLLAFRRGAQALAAAPAPRRFAQGMAGTMMLVIALAISRGWTITAAVFEGLLLAAIAALLFGKLCVGAYFYHLMRGEHSLANATLPWVRER